MLNSFWFEVIGHTKQYNLKLNFALWELAMGIFH